MKKEIIVGLVAGTIGVGGGVVGQDAIKESVGFVDRAVYKYTPNNSFVREMKDPRSGNTVRYYKVDKNPDPGWECVGILENKDVEGNTIGEPLLECYKML